MRSGTKLGRFLRVFQPTYGNDMQCTYKYFEACKIHWKAVLYSRTSMARTPLGP